MPKNPLIESLMEKLKKKFEPTKTYGQTLTKNYPAKKVDEKPMQKQIKDMFDPTQSEFARAVVERFKKRTVKK